MTATTALVQQPLAQVSLFADLDPAALEELAARANTRSYPKNTILINEGDRSASLYLILAGEIKIYTSNEEGQEALLTTLGPGDYFGELGLIDEEPRAASAMTLTPAKLMIIDGDDFLDYLYRYPAVAISLLKVLVRELRQQTASTRSLALMNVYERFAQCLQVLAEERDGVKVVEGISHKQLADQIYASREMVTLILKELKQGGYIEVDRKRIVIKKPLPAKW